MVHVFQPPIFFIVTWIQANNSLKYFSKGRTIVIAHRKHNFFNTTVCKFQ